MGEYVGVPVIIEFASWISLSAMPKSPHWWQLQCGGPSATPQDDGEEQATATAGTTADSLPFDCAHGE
jgi:hypothetical protein